MIYTTKNISSPVEERVEDILGNEPSTLVMPRFNTMLESAIFVSSLMEEAYTNFIKNIGIYFNKTTSGSLFDNSHSIKTNMGL